MEIKHWRTCTACLLQRGRSKLRRWGWVKKGACVACPLLGGSAGMLSKVGGNCPPPAPLLLPLCPSTCVLPWVLKRHTAPNLRAGHCRFYELLYTTCLLQSCFYALTHPYSQRFPCLCGNNIYPYPHPSIALMQPVWKGLKAVRNEVLQSRSFLVLRNL